MMLRLTATAAVTTGPLSLYSARLVHTAAANAQVRDTALSEVANLRVVADPLNDTVYFNPPLELKGLDVVISAGTLYLNVG